MPRIVVLSSCFFLLVAFASLEPASAQSGSRVYPQGQGVIIQQGSGTIVQQAPVQTFEQKFWNYLKKGSHSYDEWAAFPENRGGIYKGQSPHGAMLRTFGNKIARSNPTNPPDKSVLVKENYGPDGKTLMAITVMYKSVGYDRSNGDWYYVKYNPNGTVARTPPEKGNVRIAGKFQSCIECHAGAGGNDYVYAND